MRHRGTTSGVGTGEKLQDSSVQGKLGGTDLALLRYSKVTELGCDLVPSPIANSFKAVLKGQYIEAWPSL